MANSPHDALLGYTFAQVEQAAPLLRRVLQAPPGAEALVALSEHALTTTHVAPGALIEMARNEVGRRASKIMATTAMRLRQEGRREGREEERRRLLTRQLTTKFGELPFAAAQRIA
jgi:hypothetical protein